MSVSSIYLGMAIQSFVIAVLMKVNLIEVSPGQHPARTASQGGRYIFGADVTCPSGGQMSKVYLGMAMQSFIVAVIMKLELVNVTPAQQALAGAMFMIIAGLFTAVEK